MVILVVCMRVLLEEDGLVFFCFVFGYFQGVCWVVVVLGDFLLYGYFGSGREEEDI